MSDPGCRKHLAKPSHILFESKAAIANQRSRQTFPAFAHEADLPGGIANDHGICRNIPNDNGTSADEGVVADGHTANDGGIRANRGPLMNIGVYELLAALLDLSAGIEVIRENSIGADKYVISEGNTVPQSHAVLNRDSITDRDVRLDESVIADIAMLTNKRAGHDV